MGSVRTDRRWVNATALLCLVLGCTPLNRGPLNRDDPKRRPLLDELSALTQLRNWLKSETNRTLTLPLDELARELAPLKVRDRRRIQIIGEVISRSHSLDEH